MDGREALFQGSITLLWKQGEVRQFKAFLEFMFSFVVYRPKDINWKQINSVQGWHSTYPPLHISKQWCQGNITTAAEGVQTIMEETIAWHPGKLNEPSATKSGREAVMCFV